MSESSAASLWNKVKPCAEKEVLFTNEMSRPAIYYLSYAPVTVFCADGLDLFIDLIQTCCKTFLQFPRSTVKKLSSRR